MFFFNHKNKKLNFSILKNNSKIKYQNKKNLSNESDQEIFPKQFISDSDGFHNFMGVNYPFKKPLSPQTPLLSTFCRVPQLLFELYAHY